jgi:hypothetical protein
MVSMSNTDKPSQSPDSDSSALKSSQSWAETALSSVWSAIKSPVTGIEQMAGAAPAAASDSGNQSAEIAGHMSGAALLYGGATMLGRMAIGRFAAPIVGQFLAKLFANLDMEKTASILLKNALSYTFMVDICARCEVKSCAK